MLTISILLLIAQPNPLELRVEQLINRERVSRGLPALKDDMNMHAAIRANTMAANRQLKHGNPVPYYKYYGENIGKGQLTAKGIVEDWMNSPGHRKNILDPRFTEFGVAVAFDKNGIPYWSLVLGGNK